MRNQQAPWVWNKLNSLEGKIDALSDKVEAVLVHSSVTRERVERNASDIQAIRRAAWKFGALALTAAGLATGLVELLK